MFACGSGLALKTNVDFSNVFVQNVNQVGLRPGSAVE